jgi:uncharacterized membrane protein
VSWILAAVASAFFAGITSILAKCGLSKTDSDVATALRTLVVLVFAWVMVAVVGSAPTISSITPWSWLFLALSGLATGGSWICYFKALSLGDVNKVVPIDKSSTIMAVLLAIVLFGETSHLAVKLIGTAVIAAGTFMMIEKKQSEAGQQSRAWLVYALLSAVFAALTSVLAKVGIDGVESNLATAIRTCFVLVMAWAIVVGKGKLSDVRHVDGKELGFLVASGIATGASWLFFYYAIQMGQVSVVVQIDKLSILISIAFAWIVFKERLTKRSAAGLALIVAGTLAMGIWT